MTDGIRRHPKKRAFLAAFRESGNVRLACETAGVGRSSTYRWLDEDAEYREAFDLAKEDAADTLEAEAYRRAVRGVKKPVGWYKGEPGGQVTEYSDTLLIFLLKGARPEKYRERLELRGAIANLDMRMLPDALLARIAGGEHPLQVLASVEEGMELLGLPSASSGSGPNGR